MKRLIYRGVVGLLFAAPLMLLSVALVQAGPRLQADAPVTAEDCQNCHPAFQAAWAKGAHGRATSDPVFQEKWAAEGSPRECLACHTTGYDPSTDTYVSEGITCEACHSPIPANHPTTPMPVDRSANLCGRCHTETLFEWQASQHRKDDLTCVGCHGPHSTDLKSGDASSLCASCHQTRASGFAHSQHSQEGLTCADCHLSPLGGEKGEGHSVRDHSFNVQLSTCNECHAYQMHDPTVVQTNAPGGEPPQELDTMGVSAEPEPVNAGWFAIISGLVGMAGGMILAPWLERWYRHLGRNNGG